MLPSALLFLWRSTAGGSRGARETKAFFDPPEAATAPASSPGARRRPQTQQPRGRCVLPVGRGEKSE